MGGITLFLVGVQVLTGILLLLYYRPSAGEAYESVKFIVSQVEFGWLIRNVHSWSANLLILMTFVHLFSTLFLRSYRKPRELTWVTGVLLLFVMMGFVLGVLDILATASLDILSWNAFVKVRAQADQTVSPKLGR